MLRYHNMFVIDYKNTDFVFSSDLKWNLVIVVIWWYCSSWSVSFHRISYHCCYGCLIHMDRHCKPHCPGTPLGGVMFYTALKLYGKRKWHATPLNDRYKVSQLLMDHFLSMLMYPSTFLTPCVLMMFVFDNNLLIQQILKCNDNCNCKVL